MDLPLLIVHGPWIWKIAVGLLVAGVLAAITVNRKWRARAEARTQRDALDTHDPAVVRGTLRGGGAQTVIAASAANPSVPYDWRADDLWIETADGKVTLAGAVRVVAGTRAAAVRRRTPRATEPALLAAHPDLRTAKLSSAMLAALAPGDAVIARGRLERTPGDGEAGYRVADAVLTLHPGDTALIYLAAAQPRGAAPRLSIFVALVVAVVTGAIGWKIAAGLGETWRKTCWDGVAIDGEDRFELTNTDACALAAAMPDSRASALDAALEQAERAHFRDAASLHRIFALAEVAEGCEAAVKRMVDAQRWEEAEAAARRCGDARSLHFALLAQGKFAAASDVRVPATDQAPELPGVPTLILAGRWADAAAAVDAHAKDLAAREHTPDEQQSYDMTALHMKCLAELLRHDGGDAGAEARLRALAAGPLGNVCDPALGQLLPAGEQGAPRAHDDDRPEFADTARLRDVLAWLGGAPAQSWDYQSPEHVLAMPDDLGSWSSSSNAWIVKLRAKLPATTAGTAEFRAHELSWRTVAQVLDGDLAAAAATAREATAITLPANERSYDLRDLPMLPAVVALYTDATAIDVVAPVDPLESEIWHHDFAHLLVRRGDPIDAGEMIADEKLVDALRAAQGGDGRRFAVFLGNEYSYWNSSDVMAVLPRVKQGRDELVRQLVYDTPRGSAEFDYHFPFGFALCVAVRRDVLRMAGVPDEAARWDAIYRRIDHELGDRQKLVALLLWDI